MKTASSYAFAAASRLPWASASLPDGNEARDLHDLLRGNAPLAECLEVRAFHLRERVDLACAAAGSFFEA
jgi:hypothetical protein